jgi:hypothetical protein
MKIPPFTWTILAIVVLTAIDLALFTPPPIAAGTFMTALLLWCLVIGVGVGGVFAFLGHFFRGDEIARRIGWQPGSPFQREVAFANLAIGVTGLGCLIMPDGYWLATIIVAAVFLFCAGLWHIHETKVFGNVSELNTGAILAWDLGFPVILVILFVGSAVLPA